MAHGLDSISNDHVLLTTKHKLPLHHVWSNHQAITHQSENTIVKAHDL